MAVGPVESVQVADGVNAHTAAPGDTPLAGRLPTHGALCGRSVTGSCQLLKTFFATVMADMARGQPA